MIYIWNLRSEELIDLVITHIVIFKLRSRSRSGEGQEGQSPIKSSSENSKLKDLDLSHTINL